MRLGADLKTLVMKITEKENLLLRRALDPASSPNEAEAAMAAFARSLRRRGISGYDFVPPDREPQPTGPQARPSDAPPRYHAYQQPPPPEDRPKPPPEPPKWDADSMRGAYEQAAATDSMRPEVQPTKGKSGRVVGCFFTIVSWLLIGMISNQCRHGGLNTSDYRKHLDEATGVNSEPPRRCRHTKSNGNTDMGIAA
jgi:hypothetical protein